MQVDCGRLTMKFSLLTLTLLAAAPSCAQPKHRAGSDAPAANRDEQSVLDQIPTEDQAASQAEREVNEANAQRTLDEIRREVGGR